MKKLNLFLFVLMTLIAGANVFAQSEISYDIRHQYTFDGWLQHIAVYQNAIIGTTLAGPRKNLQVIILSNGSSDMCNKCKHHKTHYTHKYSWIEVNTYKDYQIANW